MKDIIPIEPSRMPGRGVTCKVTIETPDATYIWEGEFWDAEMYTDYVEVTRSFDVKAAFLPTEQHFRLHLRRPA
jgi:hypothetical protein